MASGPGAVSSAEDSPSVARISSIAVAFRAKIACVQRLGSAALGDCESAIALWWHGVPTTSTLRELRDILNKLEEDIQHVEEEYAQEH